jgi:hypothetical protein
MERLAVEKARDVHRRYPGLPFPIDMVSLADEEGCEVLNWPFLDPVREVKRGRWIGLAENIDDKEQRHLIAHALAHHLLHSGNQLSFHQWQRTNLLKQEREAEECAAHILMPEAELERLGVMPVWEIAEYFGVLEGIVEQRLTEFATEAELARWSRLGESEDRDV